MTDDDIADLLMSNPISSGEEEESDDEDDDYVGIRGESESLSSEEEADEEAPATSFSPLKIQRPRSAPPIPSRRYLVDDFSQCPVEVTGSWVPSTPSTFSYSTSTSPNQDTLGQQPFVWQSNPPIVPSIPFTSKRKLKVVPDGAGPIDYFNLLLTDEFITYIVQETNKYASFLKSSNFSPHSRIKRWKDLTNEEFLVFLGITYHTGTIAMPRLKEYWSTKTTRNGLLHVPCFSEIMARDRYLSIMQALHFANNPGPDDPTPTDRLYKIRPFINYFNDRMKTVYDPGQELAIDESMVLWRGRLSYRQYIPNKRHKYGMKLYMLKESSGLALKFILYAGSGDKDVGGRGHSEKVIDSLMEGKTGLGHHLYQDKFYNSVPLTKKLLDRKTYVTGTLRKGLQLTPSEVERKKLKRGETVKVYSNEGICVMKWYDKREVMMVSSFHNADMVKVTNKRGKVYQKPSMFPAYNQFMGRVDNNDQILSYYPCSRKSLKWYKKLSIHLFQMILTNSFYLSKIIRLDKSNPTTFHDFRLNVIQALVMSQNPNRPHVNIPTNLPSLHFPKLTDTSKAPSKAGRKLRLICKFCKKSTKYICPACSAQNKKIGLCPECFEGYHQLNLPYPIEHEY